MVVRVTAGIFLIVIAQVMVNADEANGPIQKISASGAQNLVPDHANYQERLQTLDEYARKYLSNSTSIRDIREKVEALRIGETAEFLLAKLGNETYDEIQDKFTRALREAEYLKREAFYLQDKEVQLPQMAFKNLLIRFIKRYIMVQDRYFASAYKDLAEALKGKVIKSEGFTDTLHTSLLSLHYRYQSVNLQIKAQDAEQDLRHLRHM